MKTGTTLLAIAAAMMFALNLQAQNSLVGRTYYNANIMTDALNEVTKDMDKKVQDAKAEEIAKLEKKEGRKATRAEIAEIDAKMQKAQKMMEAMTKGMTTELTVTFKTEKEAVMKANISVSDEALKNAGIGWMKRKALKAAIALIPSTEKSSYIVKGNLVIMIDDDEGNDTLRLSNDGKYLFGKFDKKTDYKLTRTQ